MKYYCQMCNQQFNSFSKFRKHNKVHPHICKYCGEEFDTGSKLAGHLFHCKLNPRKEQIDEKRLQKIKQTRVGFHHTDQTKKKISQYRKQYLKQHPQKLCWGNGGTCSKPCEDLKQFLTDNNIKFYPQYSDYKQFNDHFYRIDIAFPNQKIAIEVNGNQHYNKDGTLALKYQIKHDIIKQAGWKIIELPCRKVYNKEVRQSLLKLIKQNIDFTYDYNQQIKQKEMKIICPLCGERKTTSSKYCKNCSERKLAQQRRKKIPSKQQLIKDKEQLHTYIAIGKKYNRSGNAVKRWFVVYNLI